MMKSLIVVGSMVVLVLVPTTLARAATDGTVPGQPELLRTEAGELTLDEALQLAEQLHPDLAEGRALVDAAEGRILQAGRFPNPEAIGLIESAPFRGRTADDAEYAAGVSQPIPLSGRLGKARAAERAERDRRIAELAVRRREIRSRIRNAFATALFQRDALRTQNDIVSGIEKVVAITKLRIEAGDAVPDELARVEMELVRAKVEADRNESLRQRAMLDLKTAVGDPELPVKTLEGELDTIFDVPSLPVLIAALPNSPELALAKADVRASEARHDLARAERIPDVRVEMLYRRFEDTHGFDVGVAIPLPLFDRKRGRIREARAELAAAEARSRSAYNTVRTQLQDAYAELTTAQASARSIGTEMLPRAESVLKAAEARFEAGDIGLRDLLPIQRDWAAAQLIYLEASRDVMQAWTKLRPFINEPGGGIE